MKITPSVKKILLEWLYEVSCHYHIEVSILQHAENLLDRFDTMNIVDIKMNDYQLIGCVILNLALKYLDDEEEIPIDEWCYLTANSYEKKDFIKMEMFVLQTLDYNIN